MAHKIVVYDRVSKAPVAHLDPDERLPPIQLGENLWLSVAPSRLPPLWFVEAHQHRRRPDVEAAKADGQIYVEIAGEVCCISPEAWADTLKAWKFSEEEAQALAWEHGGVQLSELFPMVAESKPGRPRTLKELAAWFLRKNPGSQNAPEFVLMIDESFTRLDSSTSTVSIRLDDIREKCHNGRNPDVDTIRRTTISPVKNAFRKFDLPYLLRLRGDFADITKFR
jgi:hypothetical protein